jgi:hypothetical protein
MLVSAVTPSDFPQWTMDLYYDPSPVWGPVDRDILAMVEDGGGCAREIREDGGGLRCVC